MNVIVACVVLIVFFIVFLILYGTLIRRRGFLIHFFLCFLGMTGAVGFLYLWVGNPGVEDQINLRREILFLNLSSPNEAVDFIRKVENLEEDLQMITEDNFLQWSILAEAQKRLGRYDSSIRTYKRILAFRKEEPILKALYGETLVLMYQGRVIPESLSVFIEVLKEAPNNIIALFFIGLYYLQKDRPYEAAETWRYLYLIADKQWEDLRYLQQAQILSKSLLNINIATDQVKGKLPSLATLP